MARSDAESAVLELLVPSAQRCHHEDERGSNGQPLRDEQSMRQKQPELRLPHRRVGETAVRLHR